jgi:hypothetical protein
MTLTKTRGSPSHGAVGIGEARVILAREAMFKDGRRGRCGSLRCSPKPSKELCASRLWRIQATAIFSRRSRGYLRRGLNGDPTKLRSGGKSRARDPKRPGVCRKVVVSHLSKTACVHTH